MDRTSASNYLLNGGLRQYQDVNQALNVQGTSLVAADRNAVQEELMAIQARAGVVGASGNWGQVVQSIARLGAANVTTIAAAGTTALTADNAGLVLVNAAAGAIAIELPAVASAGGVPLRFRFVRTDATANAITFAAAGADLFEAAFGVTFGGPVALGVNAELTLLGDGLAHWQQPEARPFAAVAVYAIVAGVQQVSVNGAPFTTTGATTFVVPPSGRYEAEGWGAGGGSGGVNSGCSSGGGAAGTYGKGVYASTPGTALTVTVGIGGAAGGTGGNGGATSLGTVLTCPGGGGSPANAVAGGSAAGGVSGGAATGAAVTIAGQAGSVNGQIGTSVVPGAGAAAALIGGMSYDGYAGAYPGMGAGGAVGVGASAVGAAGGPGYLIVRY